MKWKLLGGLAISAVFLVAFFLFFGRPALFAESKWKIVRTSTSIDEQWYSGIRFFNSSDGIVIGPSSVLRSSDGGVSWSEIKGPDHATYYSLKLIDSESAWVSASVDNKIMILRTTDKGVNWKSLTFDELSQKTLQNKLTNMLDFCLAKSGEAWAVGQGGIVQFSDKGTALSLKNFFPINETLRNVACNDDGSVWAVGAGTVHRYQKNEWTHENLGSDYFFRKAAQNTGVSWLLGGRRGATENDPSEGVVLRSEDNGKTWGKISISEGESFNDIYFTSNKTWIVGTNGAIFHSMNGGNDWIKNESPTKVRLTNVFFIDENTGWASGDQTTILKY
jgi:photosystem II stability/assembly factor-like uncharacterized protein